MSITFIYYKTCRMEIQTVSPTLSVFQGINIYIQYVASLPHKPIFYPYHSYDGSNVIILTWSGNQVEDYTNQNF